MTPLVRHLLSGEQAHKLAIKALSLGLAPTTYQPVVYKGDKPIPLNPKEAVFLPLRSNEDRSSNPLVNRGGGILFPNPVGLAAGFDKDCEVPIPLFRVGFGAVEIGSITPKPQPGNPRPRVFRLEEDKGVVNRYGFNSTGKEHVLSNVQAFKLKSNTDSNPNIKNCLGDASVSPKLGINLGKNKLSPGDSDEDYLTGIDTFIEYADYLVVNISSPNTPGLRGLQDAGPLKRLLNSCVERVASNVLQKNMTVKPPLFVKLSPDLNDLELQQIAQVLNESKVDGIIISNTSTSRPATLTSPAKTETGGLSGAPIFAISTKKLAKLYIATHGLIPIIGVGGISSGADAYQKIRNGASCVQLYSMLTYEGLGLVRRIREELQECLERDGVACIEDIVGIDCREEMGVKKRLVKVGETMKKKKKGWFW